MSIYTGKTICYPKPYTTPGRKAFGINTCLFIRTSGACIYPDA